MKYYVSMAGREVEVVVDGDRVIIDGAEHLAHLLRVPGTPVRHLLVGDRSFTIAVEPAGKGRWTLGFHGDRWEAEVVDQRVRHIRSLTATRVAPSGAGVLKAPMPGLVVRIQAAEGQDVVVGQGIVVLEAMKMENELRSVFPGKIKTIRVLPGQAVEKGQVLVQFE